MSARVPRLVGTGLPYVVLVLGALLLAATTVLPRLLDAQALTVLTGSMSPSIPTGSLVMVSPVDPLDVVVGDVITFEVRPGSGAYVTHRVVEVLAPGQGGGSEEGSGPAFRTKGDANAAPDALPAPAAALRGRVTVHLPYLGGVRDTLASPSGLVVLAAAGAVVLWGGPALQGLRRAGGTRRGSGADAAVRPVEGPVHA